ncbi:MAG: hypothetical protein V1872_12010 [bacterium]
MAEEKKGCFGCLTSIFSFIFFIVTLLTLFWILKNVFTIPSEKKIPISKTASRDCRKKLASLTLIDKNSVSSIFLKEIELNSFFHEELNNSEKKQAISDMSIDVEKDNLELSGTISLSELSFFNNVKLARLGNFLASKKLRIKVSGDVRIKKGKLVFEPEKVTLGKQRFPVALIVPLMKKINEQMFEYELPPSISDLRLKKDTILLQVRFF